MHSITKRFSFAFREKIGHEFEWGGIYGKIWKNEREGRNVIIKLWFRKLKITS